MASKSVAVRETMSVESIVFGIKERLDAILQSDTYEQAVALVDGIKWELDMQAEYVAMSKQDAEMAGRALKQMKAEFDAVLEEKFMVEETLDNLQSALVNWHWATHDNLKGFLPDAVRDLVRKIRENADEEFEEIATEALYETHLENAAMVLCELAELDHQHLGVAQQIAEALLTRDADSIRGDERVENFLAILLENLY